MEQSISPKDIALFYYNPNIHPESEWHARRIALQDTCGNLGYKVIVSPWKPKEYFNEMADLVTNKNIDFYGQRCPRCYLLRLKKTFEYAKTNGFSAVSSTMLSSPHMNTNKIIEQGKELEKEIGLLFLAPPVTKCDGCFTGFYIQNYCGCVYSLKDRLEEKHLGKIE
jgi:predicted adenine nucleotide alpha hydrolase (AANH) superfamily ATPase